MTPARGGIDHSSEMARTQAPGRGPVPTRGSAPSARDYPGDWLSGGLDRSTLVVAGVVTLGLIMAVLDTTIVIVALDTPRGSCTRH